MEHWNSPSLIIACWQREGAKIKHGRIFLCIQHIIIFNFKGDKWYTIHSNWLGNKFTINHNLFDTLAEINSVALCWFIDYIQHTCICVGNHIYDKFLNKILKSMQKKKILHANNGSLDFYSNVSHRWLLGSTTI